MPGKGGREFLCKSVNVVIGRSNVFLFTQESFPQIDLFCKREESSSNTSIILAVSVEYMAFFSVLKRICTLFQYVVSLL